MRPPQGYTATGGDCDDTRAGVNPGAQEVCDPQNLDEDCDGVADDADPPAVGKVTWFADGDADGFGDPGATLSACDPIPGYAATDGDCDGTRAGVNFGAQEVCVPQHRDEDCDGSADDADPSAVGKVTWLADGFGDPGATLSSCDPPQGYAATGADCDDGNAAINPGAQEICDADNVDEDCDGFADDADPSAVGKVTWFADGDFDAFGTSAVTIVACDPPPGFVATGGDCDDTRSGVNPGAQEICDAGNFDEDCDGVADDADPSVVGKVTWFADGDADGFGDPGATVSACDPPGGFIADNQDCNDGNGAIHPGATEIVNLVDDDCDGAIDEAP